MGKSKKTYMYRVYEEECKPVFVLSFFENCLLNNKACVQTLANTKKTENSNLSFLQTNSTGETTARICSSPWTKASGM